MVKKICIVTTSEEKFFTPSFLKYCVLQGKLDVEIVFVPGFLNFKKIIYMMLMLSFREMLKVFVFIFFKNKVNYNFKNHKFKSINKQEFYKFVNKRDFDLLVSYNCNQIFKKNALKKINCDIVNFHPGLLPKYKGLFPNYYSLRNKEKFIGITFHVIEKKIDSGNIIKKLKIKINKDDTIFNLYKKIFLNEHSHKFMFNCIYNYKKLIKHNFKSSNFYKYNGYPKLIDIIKFKFNL
ncbi:formyltransferase family protein [Candidatus Pelagibacter sp. HIMB1593]|uniref:formyltransferase family protein n=1 Tax=Candidatus Pelagibacter sp. HIMB1593 TaxID=3413355 RepID=UPI003F827F42